jgi:hypothetical protein
VAATALALGGADLWHLSGAIGTATPVDADPKHPSSGSSEEDPDNAGIRREPTLPEHEGIAPEFAMKEQFTVRSPDRGTIGGSGANRDYRMFTYDNTV